MATTIVMLLLLPEEFHTVDHIHLLEILYLRVVYVIAHNEHFVIQNFGEIFARVLLCLWTYSAIGLICLLLVCDVCNVAMATGRVAILTNTRGLQFQSLSNDRCDVINCEWNDSSFSFIDAYIDNSEDKTLLKHLSHWH